MEKRLVDDANRLILSTLDDSCIECIKKIRTKVTGIFCVGKKSVDVGLA